MLQITLDELDVFSSWLSTKDAGFDDNDRETKGKGLKLKKCSNMFASWCSELWRNDASLIVRTLAAMQSSMYGSR